MKPHSKPPVWWLIDGQNTVHRDAYGAGVTRAAETLGKRLDMMQQRWEPAAIITCWDTDAPTFRHRLLPAYKTGRKRLEGIPAAIEACKAVCRDRGIATMDAPGYEADDLIATLADSVRRDGCNVVIYSGDKDLHQLLRAGEVSQLTSVRRRFGKIECEWVTESSLVERYGIRPDQWVDYKVLVGDPSDAIEGVSGIGHQIAVRVLKDCGTLESFFTNPFAAAVSRKKMTAISNAKKRVPLLRQLCMLRRDVPLPELWREGV